MKQISLFLIIFLPISFLFGQTFTEIEETPFAGVSFSSIAFADIDGDNDLDVLITGDTSNQSEPISKLYTNDGNGIFSEVAGTPFEGVSSSSVAFGDIDGDGDVDVLISGRNSSYEPISNLFTNDGTGVFSEVIDTPFEKVSSASVTFADIDGDNDLDVLITGDSSPSWPSQPISKLYTNDGSGLFSEVANTPFDAVFNASVAFVDIDGDNDLDLFISGSTPAISPASPAFVPKLYTNDGSGLFSEVANTPFEGVRGPSIAFADTDEDDDLDLLITGRNSSYQPIAKLFANDGNGMFSEVADTPFEGVSSSSIAFADVDGDTDMDVLITGDTFNQSITLLYINDGSGLFSEVAGTSIIGYSNSSIAFADIDGDTDLDILMTGNASFQPTSKLYSNDQISSTFNQIEKTNDVIVFPNPAHHELKVSNLKFIDTVTIYDSQGQVIQHLPINNEELTIDVSNLPLGVYLLQFQVENSKTITKKILKL